MTYAKTLLFLALISPALLSARITYLEASEVVSSDLTASPGAILGPPDSPDAAAGAGTRWAGMGNGRVVLRFPAATRDGRPVAAGVIRQRANHANFILYEHQGGSPEPSQVKVEWRTDFTFDFWQEAVRVPDLEQIPKDNHDISRRFGYFIAANEDREIEVRLTGLASQPPSQTNTSAPGFDLDAVARVTRDIPVFEGTNILLTASQSRDVETVRVNGNLWVTVLTQATSPPTWRLIPTNARTGFQTEAQEMIALEARREPDQVLRRAHLASNGRQIVVAVHYDEKINFIRYNLKFQETGRVSYPLPPSYQNQDEVALDLTLAPSGLPLALLAGGREESLILNFTANSWQSGTLDVFSFLPSQAQPGALENIARHPTVQVNSSGLIYACLINRQDFGETDPREILTLAKLPLVNGLVSGFGNPFASRAILEDGFDDSGELGSSMRDDRFLVIGGFDFSGEILAGIFEETTPGNFRTIPGNDQFLGLNQSFEVARGPNDEIFYAYLDRDFFGIDRPSVVSGKVVAGRMSESFFDGGRGIDPAAGVSLTLSATGYPVITAGSFGPFLQGTIGIVRHLVPADFADFDRDGLGGLAELTGLGSQIYSEPIEGSHGGQVALRVPPEVIRDDSIEARLISPNYCYELESLQDGRWTRLPNSRIERTETFRQANRTTVIWDLEEPARPEREVLRITVRRN